MYSTSLTWCFHPRHNPKTYILNGYTYSMARSYHVGGRTLETLCSGKHHKAGHNLQILTDQAGEIFYISPPLPGSTHDITAIRNTGLFDYMQPWHCTADKGYVGLGCDTPFKRRPSKPLLKWQQRFNKGINAIRYVVERSIAHLKVWRILSTSCRLPQPTTIRAINVIRKIMFYQPPAKPHFPSNRTGFKVTEMFFLILSPAGVGWLSQQLNKFLTMLQWAKRNGNYYF